MMSWKKRQSNWKIGWNAIRKSLLKSRSAPRIRNNSATKCLNAKDAEVFAEDAEENLLGTFAENLASLAFQVGPSLPFYLLPTAHGFFFSAERYTASASSTFADSGPF